MDLDALDAGAYARRAASMAGGWPGWPNSALTEGHPRSTLQGVTMRRALHGVVALALFSPPPLINKPPPILAQDKSYTT